MVQGLKERKSHFNMLVFFSLNQGERLLAFTALCRAKELKKNPELGQGLEGCEQVVFLVGFYFWLCGRDG